MNALMVFLNSSSWMYRDEESTKDVGRGGGVDDSTPTPTSVCFTVALVDIVDVVFTAVATVAAPTSPSSLPLFCNNFPNSDLGEPVTGLVDLPVSATGNELDGLRRSLSRAALVLLVSKSLPLP